MAKKVKKHPWSLFQDAMSEGRRLDAFKIMDSTPADLVTYDGVPYKESMIRHYYNIPASEAKRIAIQMWIDTCPEPTDKDCSFSGFWDKK